MLNGKVMPSDAVRQNVRLASGNAMRMAAGAAMYEALAAMVASTTAPPTESPVSMAIPMPSTTGLNPTALLI